MKSKRQSQQTPIIFPNLGLWSQGWHQMPGSKEDYRELAGPLYLNSVISIGLRWISDNYFEADLDVIRGKGKGKGKPLDDHPTLRLLNNPNPYYDGSVLAKGYALSDTTDGNTYLVKQRNGYGEVVGLYYLYHEHVTPVSYNGDFISYYLYQPLWGTPLQQFAPDDVIHIRNGMDPLDMRLGMSALKSQLREVAADNSASSYTSALLRNMGAIPFIISPAEKDSEITPEQAAKIKKTLLHNTGDNAGDPSILNAPIAIQQIGLSPEDMTLDRIRFWSEDRLLAAMGLNSIAMGLTSGAGSKTFANYEQAIQSCYEGCLKPMQTRWASGLNKQLLAEMDPNPNVMLGWDYSAVSALCESQDSLNARVESQWSSGLIDRYEARSILGYEVTDADRGVLYRSQQQPQNAFPAST